MIEIKTIRMHFSEMSGCTCGESRWETLNVGRSYGQVAVHLDLERDEYIFNALCTGCGNFVENRRRFK